MNKRTELLDKYNALTKYGAKTKAKKFISSTTSKAYTTIENHWIKEIPESANENHLDIIIKYLNCELKEETKKLLNIKVN